MRCLRPQQRECSLFLPLYSSVSARREAQSDEAFVLQYEILYIGVGEHAASPTIRESWRGATRLGQARWSYTPSKIALNLLGFLFAYILLK